MNINKPLYQKTSLIKSKSIQGLYYKMECDQPSFSFKIRGMENYPIAYIPHPVGSLNEDKLRERAIEITPKIIAILT